MAPTRRARPGRRTARRTAASASARPRRPRSPPPEVGEVVALLVHHRHAEADHVDAGSGTSALPALGRQPGRDTDGARSTSPRCTAACLVIVSPVARTGQPGPSRVAVLPVRADLRLSIIGGWRRWTVISPSPRGHWPPDEVSGCLSDGTRRADAGDRPRVQLRDRVPRRKPAARAAAPRGGHPGARRATSPAPTPTSRPTSPPPPASSSRTTAGPG